MSVQTNSLKPLDLVNIVDPRLKCLTFGQEKQEYGVVKGASYSNYQQQKANAYSQAGISFNWNTQGQSTMIDRRIYVKCQFQVSMTGIPNIDTFLFNDSLCSPRAFPLGSTTENLTVTINGTSITTSYADVLQALLRYNGNNELSQYDLSGTPTMLDNYATYEEGVGTVRNPLNTYGDSGQKDGRGSFKVDVISNPVGDGNNSKTAVVKFTVVEPLIMSPMGYSSQHLEQAFIGVNNFAIQMNFSNLNRVWSQVLQGTENLTDFNVKIGAGITEQPELLINYLSTPLVDEVEIPNEVVYDYCNLDTYQNDQNTVIASGASQTFTNNAIQLSTVPSGIWIYCAVPRGSKTFEDADAFFRINNISLQYLNVSGQFSSATINDLYNLSVKNGCKMSFQEWSGFSNSYNVNIGGVPMVGSVLKIDATDLALPSNLAPSCNANSQLQFKINITNQSKLPREVSIYTIVANSGLMTIAENSMMTQLAVLTQEDVLLSRRDGDYRDNNTQTLLYGGSFWGSLKNLGKSISKFVKRTGLDKVAEEEIKTVGKEMIRNKIRGTGGALVGGKQLSRAELKMLMA